jgi:hypothetical protein
MYQTEWNGFKYRVINESSYYLTQKVCIIEKIYGEWPDDKDLISLCDGTIPSLSCHFGGRVQKVSDNTAIVTINID